MKRGKKFFITSVLLSVFFWCWSHVGGCSPTPMYNISESELQTLEMHLSELERNNETLQSILDGSTMDLSAALSELTVSRQELTLLRAELTKCRADAQSAKESLAKANSELQSAVRSLRESENAHSRTEKRLRNQRTAWQIIAILLGGFAAAR